MTKWNSLHSFQAGTTYCGKLSYGKKCNLSIIPLFPSQYAQQIHNPDEKLSTVKYFFYIIGKHKSLEKIKRMLKTTLKVKVV